MARAISDEIKQKVVAAWRTNEYSQRELASKYGVSNGMVAKLCKDIEQDMSAIVSAGIQYKQGLRGECEQVVSAVEQIVDRKLARMQKINDASMEIVDITMEALKREPTVQNASAAQKTLNDSIKGAGLVSYYPTPASTTINASATAQAGAIAPTAIIIE